MNVVAEPAIAFAGLAVAAALAHRVGLSVVPAFILAGLVLGGAGLGVVAAGGFVQVLGSLGLLFLLFFMGLEYAPRRLLRGGRKMACGGLLDLGLNFPLGFGLGLLFGFDLLASAVLGVVVYVTSSGIVAKALIELRRVANRETEPLLGLLVFEDIAAAVLLMVIAGFALSDATDAFGLSSSLAVSAAFFGAIVLVARRGGVHLHRVLGTRSEERFLLGVVAIVLLVSAVAEGIGVSGAVGAFLLGLSFSGLAQAGRIRSRIVPLRDLCGAVFFFSFGLAIDLGALASIWMLLAVLVPASLVAKYATGLAVGELHGLAPRARHNLAASLLARGEFSIAAVGVVAVAGLDPALAALAAIYVTVTAVAGSFAMSISGRKTAIGAARRISNGLWPPSPTSVRSLSMKPRGIATRLKG